MLTNKPRLISMAMRLIVLVITLATGIAVSIAWKSIQLPFVSKQHARAYVSNEEYAVYSAVINHLHNESRFRVFVIRDHTLACRRGDEWSTRKWINRQLTNLSTETLDDYLLQSNKSLTLGNHFSLKATAATLSDAELLGLLARSKSRIDLAPVPSKKINWGEFYQRFGLSPGLISLSRIGFNSELNQALVYEETQANDNGTWGRYLLWMKRSGMCTVEDQIDKWFPEPPRPSVVHGEFGTLKGRILDAKAEGENTLELSVLACGWELGDLKEALARDSVVLADLMGKKTYQDPYGLSTWYKFRTREVLVEHPLPRLGFTSFGEAPAEMLPLAENEFLIHETNGTMEIDGVTVTQRSNGAEYSEGQAYLLFLWLDPATRIAIRSGTDPLGVFLVDHTGTLVPYLKRSYPLRDQIARRFDNSLEKFRQALRK